jgi:hypothetical protein
LKRIRLTLDEICSNLQRDFKQIISHGRLAKDVVKYLKLRIVPKTPRGRPCKEDITDAIRLRGYDGGSVVADFLGATFVEPTNPRESYHVQPFEGLAPGATHTMQVTVAINHPERARLVILSAVSTDGRIADTLVESAATLATWLGESIQDQNIHELTKVLTADDSDQAIDGVIERIGALDTRPPLTIDARIERLVAEPSLGQRRGAVQFGFYVGLDKAKQEAVRQLTDLKQLPEERRHKFAANLPMVYSTKIEALNRAVQYLH